MPTKHNCAVAICGNHGEKTAGTHIVYHQFPKDDKLRKIWLTRCKRGDLNFNPKYAHVCSAHFREEDYERDFEHEIMGKPIRKLLKRGSIPTAYLTANPMTDTSLTPVRDNSVEQCPSTMTMENVENDHPTYLSPKAKRQKRYNSRCDKKEVREIWQSLTPIKRTYDQSTSTCLVDYAEEERQLTLQKMQLMEENIRQLDEKNKTLVTKNQKFEKTIKMLTMRNQRLQTRLKKSIAEKMQLLMKSRIRTHRSSPDNIVKECNVKTSLLPGKNEIWLKENATQVIQGLQKLFTIGQIKYLVKPPKKNGGKRVNWRIEDIASGLAMRAQGIRAYEYQRQLGFPLPSLTTLREWTKHFVCEPGIMQEVLKLLQAVTKDLKGNDKLCVLSFDEMSIDSRVCYDQALDQIFGPHSNVQVLMVRGLTRRWKQPVFYDFDRAMDAHLLKDIIRCIEAAGLHVVAVVNDMGPKNQRVWREFGLTDMKTSFPNPVFPERNIWVFYDMPHLLKLLRNHFLDSGLTLVDGTIINKEIIEQLLHIDGHELKICFHLTPQHLSVSGRNRQNARMAAQLFSNRTARAIDYVLGNQPMSEFFQVINDGFDVLNSRVPVDEKNDKKSAFGGSRFDEQNAILGKMKKAVVKLRVGKNKSMLPFQRGMATTIDSLRGLYKEFKIIHNGKYIMTSRLNQDCLENFFSRIRRLGGFYDHPQATEVRHRIRLLILSSGSPEIAISQKAAVTQETDRNNLECENTIDSSHFEQSQEFLNYLTHELFITIEETDNQGNVQRCEVNKSTDNRQQIVDVLADELPVQIDNNDQLVEVVSSLATCPPDCGKEGLKYIAFRCIQYDRSLATPTGHFGIDSQEHDWIEVLSRGGLRRPSTAWLNIITEFEIIFAGFHGNKFAKCRGVMSSLIGILKGKFPNLNPEIIQIYVRTRTFIRIRHLNSMMRAQQKIIAAQRQKKKFAKSAKD